MTKRSRNIIIMLLISNLLVAIYALVITETLNTCKNDFRTITKDYYTDKTLFIRDHMYKIMKDYNLSNIEAMKICSAVYDYAELFELQKYTGKYDAKELVLSIIAHESGFKSDALGSAGEIGLMQIMPSTAEMVARLLAKTDYDLYNIRDNIEIGMLYFKFKLLESRDVEQALAKYNAGRHFMNYISYSNKVINIYKYLRKES
ncbi:hypothetical protein DRN58_01215 [Thermococci archaeon]|nr:MAG: hypothetical protein DRN58_01215 [Thermococci archaeon]